MKEIKYVINDELGIHARPAAMLVKETSKFPCKITISKDGKEADAKKLFAIMSLSVKCGNEIVLKADGEQENEAMEAMGKFLKENL